MQAKRWNNLENLAEYELPTKMLPHSNLSVNLPEAD